MFVKIHFLLTVIIWIGTACAYAFHRLTKSKINRARSVADMALFPCSSAKKGINMIKKIRILSLILLTITSLIVVVVLATRISLMINEQAEVKALLYDFVKSIYFFDWLSAIGLFLFAEILALYFSTIINKCDDLRVE